MRRRTLEAAWRDATGTEIEIRRSIQGRGWIVLLPGLMPAQFHELEEVHAWIKAELAARRMRGLPVLSGAQVGPSDDTESTSISNGGPSRDLLAKARQYMRHLDSCEIAGGATVVYEVEGMRDGVCTCGLEAVLAAMEE